MRLIVLAALFLSACAPHPVQAPPSAIQGVSAEVKSWGATLRRWKVDAAGQVEHVSGEKVGANRDDIVIETRRTTLSAAQVKALQAAVEKVKAVLAEPEQCAMKMTDGPYGTFAWTEAGKEQRLPFDGNCVQGRDYRLVGAIFAADKIVDDAALATTPVERHPLNQSVEVR